MPEIELKGCHPEPLMSYLKSLGILRLVAEQKDREALGWWKNDIFYLESKLDEESLVRFFVEEYEPTPIVVPWSGNDFFEISTKKKNFKFKKTPTGSDVIEAFQNMESNRFSQYCKAIEEVLNALQRSKIKSKKDMEKNKPTFLSIFRSYSSEDVIYWIDSAAVILEKSTPFSFLLGSGGGSDGNTHFSDNFMQNLWEMLPEFDVQREEKRKGPNVSTEELSSELCRNAMFDYFTDDLVPKRTSALYDSGAVGGPNSTQGMNRESLSNPWNIILLFEGTIAFSGAIVRRFNANVNSGQSPAFPFQFRLSVTDTDNTSDKEGVGKEQWLPIWHHPSTWDEISLFLGEGRAEIGRKPPRNGVDMARAIASLGVDRGISAFSRYTIVKGRVGGDNYNTAASLGRFNVKLQKNIELLKQHNFEKWLDRFRNACSAKETPTRFKSALRRIESGIFNYCRYGRREDLEAVLTALGQAEKELAVTSGKRGSKEMCPPLANLSPKWLPAINDGSDEFHIARVLAGIYAKSNKIADIRSNIEPVQYEKGRWQWVEGSPQAVWKNADLSANMAAALERRLMDGTRAGCEHLPIEQRNKPLPAGIIASFIASEVDDRRIEELLWGFMLINPRGYPKLPSIKSEYAPPLPREYALLKLLFLPRPLVSEPEEHDGKITFKWRLAGWEKDHDGNDRIEEEGIHIRSEPRILPLLRAGQTKEACRIAYQRLRVSGLNSLPGPKPSGITREEEWEPNSAINPQRLAAALLLPINNYAVNKIVHMVTRQEELADETETISLT